MLAARSASLNWRTCSSRNGFETERRKMRTNYLWARSLQGRANFDCATRLKTEVPPEGSSGTVLGGCRAGLSSSGARASRESGTSPGRSS
jgi:hypothetical protein